MDLLESIQSTMDTLEFELIGQLKSRVPVAFEIGAHIMNSGGKRIRPQLTVISAKMGGYNGIDAVTLAGAIECIHTATLLHDDVVDYAETRRGRPAANTLWSNEMCVLGGDFILAKAFSALTSLKNLRILEIVSNATARLSEGELFQMANIGNMDFSEDNYVQVITDKTAVLMEAACRCGSILGGLSSEKEDALSRFGFNLGVAFQMTDDLIDYRSNMETMGKNPGQDLQEGKLTLPLITALKLANTDEKKRLNKIVTSGNVSPDDFTWVKDFIDRRNGVAETLARSREYLSEGVKSLSIFEDSEEKMALTKISDKILHRTY